MMLSIIIINFNTPTITSNCLSTIYNHIKNVAFEVILIDNFPKLDYKQQFMEKFPKIRYTACSKNLGFGRANNLGMKQAKGKYILLLNSDTLLIDNSLEKCIEFLDNEENQNIAMLGCKLLNEDRSYQPSFYPYFKNNFINYCISNNPLLSKLFDVKNDYKAPQTPKTVGDISGAFMLLRKEVFEQTKGFDPDFFLYYEESDWCRNRILKNYKILYYPQAAIIHLGGKSAPKDIMAFQAEVSQGLFWYKAGWINFVGFILFNLANLLFFALQYLITSPSNKAAIKFRFKIMRAAISYWLFEIPKYPRKFGSRKTPLVYKPASNLFFNLWV